MDSSLASFVFSPQYGKTLYDNYQRALERAGLASRTNLSTVGAVPPAPPATGTVQRRNSHTCSELRVHVQTYTTHFVKRELCWHCVHFPSDGQAQDLHTPGSISSDVILKQSFDHFSRDMLMDRMAITSVG